MFDVMEQQRCYFQPETQRYALKRGVGYLNDIRDFLTLRSIPILLRRTAGWWLCTQRSGMVSPPAPVTFDPKTRSTRLCGSSRRGFPPLRRSGSLPTGSSSIRDGIFLSPAPETSLHVLSNLQKLKSALGLPLLVSVSRKSFLGATVGLPQDLGPASLAAELHAIGNGADYVRTHAPGDLRSAITFSETLAKFRSRDARDRGLIMPSIHLPAAR